MKNGCPLIPWMLPPMTGRRPKLAWHKSQHLAKSSQKRGVLNFMHRHLLTTALKAQFDRIEISLHGAQILWPSAEGICRTGSTANRPGNEDIRNLAARHNMNALKFKNIIIERLMVKTALFFTYEKCALPHGEIVPRFKAMLARYHRSRIHPESGCQRHILMSPEGYEYRTNWSGYPSRIFRSWNQ